MFSLTLISQLISFLRTLSIPSTTSEAANIDVVTSPRSQLRPDVSTNPRWSGAVISADSGTKYTSVAATLVLPVPSLSPNNSAPNTTYTASPYVALGGDPCQGSLQVGMDINATLIGDSQVAAYDAWYQWNPANYTILNSISFSAGDTVYLNITLTNSTSGTITVKNLNTHSTVTQDVSSTYELCQTDAEWSVSDYNDDLGPEVVYVDYGNVTFEAVRVNTIVMEGGEEGSVGADGAGIVLQKRGDEILTKVEMTERSVSVVYDGYHDEE
ncbi:concanavalin A-like lectin/glucanase [Stereum hirsutum FP-91666 SS1]|uniref:concanavalin A-like lectin/glucanase n=1 Tax=Stereum hirsutum (strain FP-91666) TaxID=721885 RepID=UPI00044492EF|nr:concanavalin A-like lectin/glucanase [Stereum hirsutum FP-91666 SS1]EIM81352.1 concanavalin A-like lectin/glucanase [Stereum hirsutum FP-91666 SS1]